MVTLAGFAFPLLLGFCVGLLFYSSVLQPSKQRTMQRIVWPITDLQRNENDFTEIEPTGGISQEAGTNLSQISFNDSHFHGDDTTVADRLFKTVRILCLVMTYPQNHHKKAIHVNATWGKRCNKLLFVTRIADENLPTLILNVTEGRDHLGEKTRDAFDHAYKHYLFDYDWFLKADDDTYVIMENLRYFLSAQDHNLPMLFGQTFAIYTPQGYPSGGAGYVASREALSRYGRRSNQTPGCGFNSGSEDIDFGRCMESVGVRLGDSLDALGRTRFHCFNTETHVKGNFPDWYYGHDQHKGTKRGLNSLSDYAISFHYVAPENMYLMEYFAYHLNPYGIIKGLQNLNSNVTTGFESNETFMPKKDSADLV